MKKYITLTLVLIAISCSESKQANKLIRDNFLMIVDTIAYQEGSLRPVSDSRSLNYSLTDKELVLFLSENIVVDNKIEEEVNIFFNTNNYLKEDFLELMNGDNYKKFTISEFPNKIGKYNIVFDKKDVDKKGLYVGDISIKNFKMNNDKAFLVVEESFGKSSIGFIILFIKEKQGWVICKRERLFIS